MVTLLTRFVGLRTQAARGVLAWSTLAFAVLQSICTFFAAVDSIRLAIGFGSLVLASDTLNIIDGFHIDWLRFLMIGIAVAGSLLNLLVLWQVRRLRARSASRWRQRSQPPAKLRSERIQMAFAVLTLILVAIEERQHLVWSGHF